MKKRKAYRPKPIELNPLARLQKTDPRRVAAVLAMFNSALLAMTQGSQPTEEDWRVLSDVVNTVETLTLGDDPKLIAAEVMPTVNEAIAGLVRAADRFKAGKGMRLDSQGIEALRDVIGFYEQCAAGLTLHEMIRAQDETQRRVHALLTSESAGCEVIAL